MQETELRFKTLKELMLFKQHSAVQELRIDTNSKSLTGRFTESEVETAVTLFKAVRSGELKSRVPVV